MTLKQRGDRRHLAAAAAERRHAADGEDGQRARRLRRHSLDGQDAGAARTARIVAIVTLRAGAAAAGASLAYLRKVPIVFPAMFVGSLVAFAVAQAVPYRLYIPDRLLLYAWPPLLLFGLLLLAYLAFSTVTSARVAGILAAVVCCALELGFYGDGFQPDINVHNWARRDDATVRFAATLPKDVLIAAPFDVSSNDPGVRAAQGAVQLAPQHAHPLSDRARARAAHRGVLPRLLRARPRGGGADARHRPRRLPGRRRARLRARRQQARRVPHVDPAGALPPRRRAGRQAHLRPPARAGRDLAQRAGIVVDLHKL